MSTQILLVGECQAHTVSLVKVQRAKQSCRGQGCEKGTGQQPLAAQQVLMLLEMCAA